MNRYVIKCQTFSGAQLYFCHQFIAGTKQNVFVSSVYHALFYYVDEIDNAEIELLKLMQPKQIKSYVIEILQVLPGNKKPG